MAPINPILGPEHGRKEKQAEYDSVLHALKILTQGTFLSTLKDASDLFPILIMRLGNKIT